MNANIQEIFSENWGLAKSYFRELVEFEQKSLIYLQELERRAEHCLQERVGFSVEDCQKILDEIKCEDWKPTEVSLTTAKRSENICPDRLEAMALYKAADPQAGMEFVHNLIYEISKSSDVPQHDYIFDLSVERPELDANFPAPHMSDDELAYRQNRVLALLEFKRLAPEEQKALLLMQYLEQHANACARFDSVFKEKQCEHLIGQAEDLDWSYENVSDATLLRVRDRDMIDGARKLFDGGIEAGVAFANEKTEEYKNLMQTAEYQPVHNKGLKPDEKEKAKLLEKYIAQGPSPESLAELYMEGANCQSR